MPRLVNMSTTVQSIMDQCRIHTKLQNYFGVGGITGQPGCGIATWVNQTLLQRRMAWKFNRVELGPTAGNFMVTQQGFQDMRFAGASAFVLLNNQTGGGTLPCGGVGIDLAQSTINNVTYNPINGGTNSVSLSGSTITVQTLDPHPFQTGNIGQSIVYLTGVVNPVYNSVFTYNQLTQTSAWAQGMLLIGIPDNQHLQLQASAAQIAAVPGPSGAPGIFNLGWIESASIQDINSTSFPQPVRPIEAVHRITPEYTATGDELTICALIDYNNGVIKFRLIQPMGTYPFQINVIYQARAPILTLPTDIFQWPNDLQYVLVDMCLYRAMKFAYGANSQELEIYRQDAFASLQSALEAEDKEANDQALTPDRTFM